MHVDAPLTTLTDYALAVAGLGFAFAVGRRIGPQNRVTAWFWCAAFIASAVGAAAGAAFHGLGARLEAGTVRVLWNLTMFSAGACGAFVTAGIHAAHVRRVDGTVKWLACGIAVTLAGAAIQQGAWLRLTVENRNAAYHLIQIAGMYFLFRCALTVHDRPGIDPRL